MRDTTIIMILALALAVLASVAHERDIYRQCLEQGDSGGAGWTIKIKCEPLT